VSIYYLNSSQASTARRFAPLSVTVDPVDSFPVFAGATVGGLAPAATMGEAGADGAQELVVGQVASDGVEVYRIRPDGPAEPVLTLAAFNGSSMSGSSNLAIGDIDPSEPGEEIVVAEDGSGRRATRLRVFGGLATGGAQLLADFRGLRLRTPERGPVAFALGDVFPDDAHVGQEIIIGDARGRIYVYCVRDGSVTSLQRFVAVADRRGISARRLAVGDLVPTHPGDEIVVADDGSRQDGLVDVLDGRTGETLFEFRVFEPGQAPAGVEVWVADVIASLPGAELIVGQGTAGGVLRVFSVAGGVPEHVLDLPDPLGRATSLRGHLTVGDLVAELPGNEIAVAQSDPTFPVQIFHLDVDNAELIAELDNAADGSRGRDLDVIGTIAIGR
jgi:hypothetical protein